MVGTRIANHSPMTPSTAHINWRLKSRHGELPWWNWLIDVADSTITKPSMVNTVTTTAMT